MIRVLDRRSLLRGAGGVAIALPLLEAMVPTRRASAATASPQRFIVYYSPGGTDMPSWRPTGTETQFTLGSSLSALERLKQHLIVLSGIDMKVTSQGVGHPHAKGMGGLLTGEILPAGPYETCAGKSGFALGRSLDQFIGDKIGSDRKFKTLELAIRWPSVSLFNLTVHPGNTIIYSAPSKPVPPALSPRAVFDRLFKNLDGATSTEQKQTQSILDAVKGEYGLLSAKLGPTDRRTLESHLAGIREMEKGLTQVGAQACVAPDLGPDLDLPYAGGTSMGGDGFVDLSNDEPMPRTGKLMMDMLCHSLACDLTRVGTLQWADSSANNTFPWLALKDTHHGYQHDRGYQPGAIAKIQTWYASQFAYFLDKLIELQENGRPLLDSTLVFWCTEIQKPDTHAQDNMPFMLAGGANGGVRPGRWVQSSGRSHNDLLVAIQNVFGIESNTFGRAEFCKGALPGLT
jgi:Protein of unknown function (DUF1552)